MKNELFGGHTKKELFSLKDNIIKEAVRKEEKRRKLKTAKQEAEFEKDEIILLEMWKEEKRRERNRPK